MQRALATHSEGGAGERGDFERGGVTRAVNFHVLPELRVRKGGGPSYEAGIF